MKEILLEVKNLKRYFNTGRKDEVHAVDDVSFTINRGETFGLVGESGSGKTTIGRTIMRLNKPTNGIIKFEGENIFNGSRNRKSFCKDVQMIFQDPYACLNPKMKIKDIVAEGIRIHNLASNKNEETLQIINVLKSVGLSENYLDRFPFELSGGQRQRVGIARALAVKPKLIIADEAISALDVSVQAQIVNLLKDLQDELGLTYLFIAHDLAMVQYISNTVGVLNQGRMVEKGLTEDVFDNPQDSYTKKLLNSIPVTDPLLEKERLASQS